MTFDFRELLSGPPSQERTAMIRDVADDMWSDFGRTVARRMGSTVVNPDYQRVVTYIFLKAASAKDAANLFRRYVLEGRLPWQS